MVFGIMAGTLAPAIAAAPQAGVAPAPVVFQDDDEAEATADDADEADTDDADDRDDDSRSSGGSGDTITVVDERGNPILEITVNEVVNPWEDFSDFSTPERGFYFLALNVTVENISDDEQEFSDFDFMVRDEFGFLYGTTFASIDEDSPSADIGELEGDDMDAGDSITGLVIFALPDDGALVDVFYAPYGRLITLATLD
jgi:hypothetical protein